MSDLDSALAAAAADVERLMDVVLPTTSDAEAPLIDAMRYASLGGGKRLRAFLAIQSAHLFGVDARCAIRVAAAIEFMHAYSLIHDDLPAMDDSDLRRGRPSCHKAFDEATAILAGDALQSLAFEILTDEGTHERTGVRLQLVRDLAHAVGAGGMAGGQMIDMIGENTALDIGAITRLQRMKTGELFTFSAGAGATLGQAGPSARAALHGFAQEFGLAFQITDDLLDVVGDADTTGKPVGLDAAAGKATFVTILGVERAAEQAGLLVDQAVHALDIFDETADFLRALARRLVDRVN